MNQTYVVCAGQQTEAEICLLQREEQCWVQHDIWWWLRWKRQHLSAGIYPLLLWLFGPYDVYVCISRDGSNSAQNSTGLRKEGLNSGDYSASLSLPLCLSLLPCFPASLALCLSLLSLSLRWPQQAWPPQAFTEASSGNTVGRLSSPRLRSPLCLRVTSDGLCLFAWSLFFFCFLHSIYIGHLISVNSPVPIPCSPVVHCSLYLTLDTMSAVLFFFFHSPWLNF